MDPQPTNKPLVALIIRNILDILEIWVLLHNLILIMPAFDEIKSIGPEHPIQLLIDSRINLLLKIFLEQLREEVNHGFEEVLILEDVFRLAVAE